MLLRMGGTKEPGVSQRGKERDPGTLSVAADCCRGCLLLTIGVAADCWHCWCLLALLLTVGIAADCWHCV